jgi:hypothetical protein
MTRTIKFQAWSDTTKRFIEKDTDIENRSGYVLGEYALRPNGELCFFSSEEGE